MRSRRLWSFIATYSLLLALLVPAPAGAGGHEWMTPKDPYVTLADGGELMPLISVGEVFDGVKFEGIPDGVGIVPGDDGTIDLLVSHEQTTIPFRGARDFQDASVTGWTIDLATGKIVSAHVAIPAEEGFIRFCSAAVVGPAEGFDDYVYFANEESSNIKSVPDGALYDADPAIAPDRQGGYAVALNTATGEYTPIAGMGRHNHENTIALPGYSRIVTMSTDDTFTAGTSQLYMYIASDQKRLFDDKGSLWAFRVTHKNGAKVNANDPFNGANDYLDIRPGDDLKGEFIRVPKQIARGLTDEAPQDALENWSNDNNVFQFVRLEDLAYDKNDPRVVYIADTGASRIQPDAETGRMNRDRTDPQISLAEGGSMFKFVMNDKNPRKVDSFTVLAQGDDPIHGNFAAFTSPDNIDTSAYSLMVQEDTDEAAIWNYNFASEEWKIVATVNDPDGESSGIVDASEYWGPGAWYLTVQAHGTNIDKDVVSIPGTLIKREDGQLLLMTVPGT